MSRPLRGKAAAVLRGTGRMVLDSWREEQQETAMRIPGCFIALFATLLALPASAAEPRTANTFQLGEGEAPPEATLEDAAWLVGSWAGTAVGVKFESVWNAPSTGSMVGLFKLFDDDEIAFYELLLLTVEDGSLSLKVKHFSADFSAWEERDEYVDFRLVAKSEDALHFRGLSFYRRGDDQIDGYIVMRNDDGITEHELKYYRRDQ